MDTPNWGLIRSGATFEALIATLVFSEDRNARLFGRPGPDGGQDVRSGTDELVYQAKFHLNGSPSDAIRDAIEEAKKIEGYQKPEHKNHTLWSTVKNWRLVTNVAFNAHDLERWKSEVVPKFKTINLNASYWGRTDIETRLVTHPEVKRAFFDGEPRHFLSVREAEGVMLRAEPFLHRSSLGRFVGRTVEVETSQTFLKSSKRFLLVTGAGGVGKSRLLFEAGSRIAGDGEWQVLWAQVETMRQSSSWFGSIEPERPTLLLVDEPSSADILSVLNEQLNGRASQWKVAVSALSTNDPVNSFLSKAKIAHTVERMSLERPSETEAAGILSQLVLAGKFAEADPARIDEWSKKISKKLREPIWLTLAVSLAEKSDSLSSLPLEAEKLAEEYLSAVTHPTLQQPKVREVMFWVALLTPVNTDNEETVKLIARQVGISDEQTHECIESLVQKNVLSRFGRNNRKVEIRPELLRDHVLRVGLRRKRGNTQSSAPSSVGKELVQAVASQIVDGTIDRDHRTILTSLARTQFILRRAEPRFELLDALFDKLKDELRTLSASKRVVLADAIDDVAFFCPQQVITLTRLLREDVVSEEEVAGIFRPRKVSQDDVLVKLASPLAAAAVSLQDEPDQDQLLNELCWIAREGLRIEKSSESRALTKGQRALDVLKRVLQGAPHYWGTYDRAAEKIGLRFIFKLRDASPSEDDCALLAGILTPLMATERLQEWNDETSFAFQHIIIGPEHPGWIARTNLTTAIKAVLDDKNASGRSREILWQVFAEAHRNLTQSCNRKNPKHKPLADLISEDLEWTLSTLKKWARELREMTAARVVWDWHRRFDKDPSVKKLSLKLEELYSSNDLAAEFKRLLEYNDHGQQTELWREKANQLVDSGSLAALTSFLERTELYFEDDTDRGRVFPLAWELGQIAERHTVVGTFVDDLLRNDRRGWRTDFAAYTTSGWVANVRRGDTPGRALEIAETRLNVCGDDKARATLLLTLYGRVPRPKDYGPYTERDHRLLRSAEGLFSTGPLLRQYIAAVAQTLTFEWEAARSLLERLLQKVASVELENTLARMVNAVYWSLYPTDDSKPTPPVGLSEWLFDRLTPVRDVEHLGNGEGWHLEKIADVCGKPSIPWLARALKKRSELEQAERGQNVWSGISYGTSIAKYAEHVDDTNCSNKEVHAAIIEILALAAESGSLEYSLPEVAQEIDPEGHLVPRLVGELTADKRDPKSFLRLIRIGGGYVIDTPPWRAIANAALKSVCFQTGEVTEGSVFSALDEHGVRSYAGRLGEVSPIFFADVDHARTRLAAEEDPHLQRFWKWKLAIAEESLLNETERVKEDPGQ